jgi:hypothetical protein
LASKRKNRNSSKHGIESGLRTPDSESGAESRDMKNFGKKKSG